MRKFLVTILSIILLFAIGQFCLYQGLRLLTDNSQIRFIRVLHENPDVVVIGNSRAVNGVHEKSWNERFDHHLINLAYNGMHPLIVNAVIHDLAKNEQINTKYYIIELTNYLKWYSKNKRDDNGALPLVKTDFMGDDFLPFRSYYPSIDSIYSLKGFSLNSLFRLTDYNSLTTNRILYYNFRSDNDWVNRRTISNAIIQHNEQLGPMELRFERDYFDQLQEIIQSNTLNVLYFVAPFHPSFRANIRNLDLAIREIEKKYSIDILDLSNLDLQSNDYADGYHTNINGSKLTTEVLHNEFKEYLQINQ